MRKVTQNIQSKVVGIIFRECNKSPSKICIKIRSLIITNTEKNGSKQNQTHKSPTIGYNVISEMSHKITACHKYEFYNFYSTLMK